ncbi:MAG: haloacid dehalogenase-like hydrolase [Candidatus Riflebacteria bacterium]|nr:haloacid dehalogenase-like hydrolase [Candidatus Riflebacteria bacterium]
MKSKLSALKVVFLFILAGLFFVQCGYAADLTELYPNWKDLSPAKLMVLERFIERHSSKKPIAVFDFDGTLISEKYPSHGNRLRSGQSAWRAWTAQNLTAFPFAFPSFRVSGSLPDTFANIIHRDEILENFTDVPLSEYMKFTELAAFEAGMTENEVRTCIDGFLKDYPPEKYVYYPMLDVIQRLIDKDYPVWIITGSNPIYVSAILKNLEEKSKSSGKRVYNFKNLTHPVYAPYSKANQNGVKIIGNISRRTPDGYFTRIYDDAFVKSPDNRHYVVAGEGKLIALENYLEPSEEKSTLFAAGNSDGDYELMSNVLKSNSLALGIMVNPGGKKFPTLAGQQTIVLNLTPGN